MLSDHELKIANFYHISIGNVKILVADFFDEEKYVLHYENLQLYLSLGLTLKNTLHMKIRPIPVVKIICWIQQTKKNRHIKKWRES